MLRRTFREGLPLKTQVGLLTETTEPEGEELSEERLAYTDLGYSNGKKIKFSSVDAGEAIAPAAIKAFKKHLVSLGVKPAMAKKLADHNAHSISHALSMVNYESL
jgi:hypothetical protein